MLDRAEKLRDRSEMISDPLSQILNLLDARCILSGGLIASGTWVRRFARPNALKIMAVVEGDCWLLMDTFPAPLRLTKGDIFLVNGKHAMTLASEPAPPAPDVTSGAIRAVSDIVAHRHDGDTLIMGGHVAVDAVRQSLLLDVLPPAVHVASTTPQAPMLDWLLDQLVREDRVNQAGAEATRALLAQLLFVQSLRATLLAEGAETSGWLKALGDRRLAPALQMIHADPARNWTIAELARGVGMSRTGFALRFRDVAGMAPLAYVFNWRMRLAECKLRDIGVPLSELAREVGYSSESAFSNAFKRATGVSPKRFRSQLSANVAKVD
ncbi:AraC family transcriptional regulator [Ancylobacter sp. MQZ15Z-1]|uniref:AraC family transcriptional regulator n=1 Tax=Ancylobacter mangrovi TaxID=2972472 RepID=A0A9X2T6X2_9HYPH|nr:AraC family transcriptional regulator [Ancylobacter mangrovi]MCS0496884.1 AraC family transcriptional regulator [Ancylobacter mangrovi]